RGRRNSAVGRRGVTPAHNPHPWRCDYARDGIRVREPDGRGGGAPGRLRGGVSPRRSGQRRHQGDIAPRARWRDDLRGGSVRPPTVRPAGHRPQDVRPHDGPLTPTGRGTRPGPQPTTTEESCAALTAQHTGRTDRAVSWCRVEVTRGAATPQMSGSISPRWAARFGTCAAYADRRSP